MALLATALGFAWRARDLGGQSFWWDEAYSAVVARGSLAEIVAAITAADFHPPLHYLLLHYWRLVAGESEYALRYVSVAAGALTIALAYATGRRLFGAVGGLAAATLTAASPYLVYYSTEARMFALAALLALLTVYTGHRATASGRRRDWLAFALALALGLWNYYYAAFTFLPLAVTASLRGRRRLGQYIAAGLLAALLYLPWIPIAFGRAVEWTSPWTAPTTPGRVLAWTWPALLTGIPALELWGDDRLRALMLAAAALLALALLAALRGPRSYAGNLWLAAAAALVPLGAMAAIALLRPIYHPRYAMPVAPALILAMAGAIALPSRRLLAVRAALALTVAAAFGWGLWRYYGGDGLTRDDYRSAIGYLAARERPGDAAITNAPPGFAYYYRGAMPFAEFPTGRYDEATIVDGLNRLAAGRARLWYVTHALRPSDPEGFVDLQLDHRAERVDERQFGQIRVALYELPARPAFAPLAFHPLPGGVRVGEELTLLGVGLGGGAERAGDELPLTLRWRVERRPASDLGVWVRLRDSDGFAWGRQDRRPRDSAFQLASGWTAG
ncbi:MAG TPA: glycosyltransferase family 39 protein, partial [Chloroflexota bacterium]